MSRITILTLVTVLMLTAGSSSAAAGESGLLTVTPVSSPAPGRQHVILYAESADQFMSIFVEMLGRGFVWLDAPARRQLPESDRTVWGVYGYIDPDERATYTQQYQEHGQVELEGVVWEFDRVQVTARTSEAFLRVLRAVFDARAELISLPRVVLQPGSPGRIVWAVNTLYFRIVDETPTR